METAKILLIGPKWSGKTTLANRLCYGTFTCETDDMIGRFVTNVKTSTTTVQLLIYDSSASALDTLKEREFIKFIDAVVCVHDSQIEDRKDTCKLFASYARKICPDALVFTVFTKIDVSPLQFEKDDLICSAATGFNI